MSGDALLVLALRMSERILAVGIGGLAIYLGYRMFVLLPLETRSEGKIELPGYSVVLSKVGPGVFFAAFGAFVLFQSFASPVEWSDYVMAENASSSSRFTGALPIQTGEAPRLAPNSPSEAQASDVPLLSERLQSLNCALDHASTLDPEDRRRLEGLKIALIRTVWRDQWGDPELLVAWALEGADVEPVSDVTQLFNQRRPRC